MFVNDSKHKSGQQLTLHPTNYIAPPSTQREKVTHTHTHTHTHTRTRTRTRTSTRFNMVQHLSMTTQYVMSAVTPPRQAVDQWNRFTRSAQTWLMAAPRQSGLLGMAHAVLRQVTFATMYMQRYLRHDCIRINHIHAHFIGTAVNLKSSNKR